MKNILGHNRYVLHLPLHPYMEISQMGTCSCLHIDITGIFHQMMQNYKYLHEENIFYIYQNNHIIN